MSDRELLEKAAKAAGVTLEWSRMPGVSPRNAEDWNSWNPLTDDGDALRLAVKLQLTVECMAYEVQVLWADGQLTEHATMGYSIEEATRRAIVRAAAAIGEQA